ncbi:MAG TPA: RNA methyltransferase [Polyangiaceae bacterium]
MVRRLLGSRYRVRSILTSAAALETLGDALSLHPDVPRYVASTAVVRAITGFRFHHGCLALGERGAELPTADLLAATAPRALVVLEQIRDPENVGSIFRNALGLGARGALLSPGTADPLYRKAIRVSAGATLSLPYSWASEWPAQLWRLRDRGYRLVGLTPDKNAVDITEMDGGVPGTDHIALVLGSEAEGLSPPVRAGVDMRVRIATVPGFDSLNVAAAVGIALHRLLAELS